MTATMSDGSSDGRRVVIGPAVVGVAVVLLGISRVGDQPFWLDEAATSLVVNRSAGGLAQVLWNQEAGMAPYYSAAWLWQQVAGGDVALRMLSVLGGAATAALLHVLARRWFGTAAAWTASVLLIANPFFLRYLTEARAYSWLMALGVAAGLATDRLTERGSRRPAVVAGLIIGVGVATHLLFGLFAMVLVAVASTTARRRPSAAQLGTLAIVATLVALPTMPASIARRRQLDWLGPLSTEAYVDQFVDHLGGPVMAALLLIGLASACLQRTSTRVTAWPLSGCVAVAIGFPIALAVFSSLIQPAFLGRYLAPSFPFLVLAAAFGFRAVSASLVGQLRLAGPILASLAAMIAFVIASPLTDGVERGVEAAAVEFILERAEPGDLVIVAHFPPAVLHHLGYDSELDPAALPIQDAMLTVPRRPTDEYLQLVDEAPTVFVIRWRDWVIDPRIERLLLERQRLDEAWFDEITVWSFTKAGN